MTMQKPSPVHRLLTLAALLAALPATAAPNKITEIEDNGSYATAINGNGSIVVRRTRHTSRRLVGH